MSKPPVKAVEEAEGVGDAPKPKPQGKSRFRGKRGKPSQEKRQDSHREKIGEQFEKERRQSLAKRLYHDLDDDLDAALLTTESKLECSVSQYPVTTRGLGFAVAASYERVARQHPTKVAPLCSPVQAYRSVLAQAALKVVAADESIAKRRLLPLPSYDVHLDSDVSSVVRGFPSSFSLAANAVEALGTAEINGSLYQPVVSPDDLLPSGEIALNPFLVHYWNYPAVIAALADPGYPVRLRRRFIRANPLPGAVYEEYLLVNADEMLPDHWPSRRTLRDDLGAYEALMSFCRSKAIRLVSELSYSGPGSGGFLVHRDVERPGCVYGTEVSLASGRFFSTVKVEEQMFNRGFIALMSERRRGVGFPNATNALVYQDNDWFSVVSAILARAVRA